MLPGRVAAVLGVAGAVSHLAMAGEHFRHAPALTAGLLLLSLVCVRCSVHLWRRPASLPAWRDLLILAVVMTLMHAAAGGLTPAGLIVPAAQTGVAVLALAGRLTSPDRRRRPASPPRPAAPPPAARTAGAGGPPGAAGESFRGNFRSG